MKSFGSCNLNCCAFLMWHNLGVSKMCILSAGIPFFSHYSVIQDVRNVYKKTVFRIVDFP